MSSCHGVQNARLPTRACTTRKHIAANYPPCVTITSHGIAALTPPLLLAVGQQLKTPTVFIAPIQVQMQIAVVDSGISVLWAKVKVFSFPVN